VISFKKRVHMGESSRLEPRWIFYFMEKDKIKEGLIAAGLRHRYDRSALFWKEAFKEYNRLHGSKLDMGCSTCIRTVKEWLDK
jgi:hypothetical protein